MTLIEKLKDQRKAMKAELDSTLRRAEMAKRGLTAAEDKQFTATLNEIRELDERVEELEGQDVRDVAAAAHRATFGGLDSRGYTRSRDTYAEERTDVSYFRDLVTSRQGDLAAATRLAENNDRVRETRAGDLVSVTATQGGTFAPPLWLSEAWVQLARPHRNTADIMYKQVLPKGISSINVPKVSGGSAAGVQATQNSTLTDVAMTTTSVSSGITLIAGKQIVSRQLIDQSGIPFDRVILTDLAADYAKQLDVQVLTGSASAGQLAGLDSAAGITVTYTTATPKVIDTTTSANSFYQALITAATKIHQQRFMPATHIVMAPRRWSWLLNATDSQGRPLISPSSSAFNAIGSSNGEMAEGVVGEVLGLPVVVDANVSLAANSTTNQDVVYVIRAGEAGDSWLYESELETNSFEPTYADQASVLFRALGYASLIHRYAPSIARIVGTGLVDPGLG
jgi:hypothetical protein